MNKLSKILTKFKYNKFNPSINEWRNSIYSFNKYNLNTYINEKIINTLLNSYFNLTPFKEDKFYSLRRIFVGLSDIKYNMNTIIFNIYIFNKEKLFYLKRIWMLKKIVNKRTKDSLSKKTNIFSKKILSIKNNTMLLFTNKNLHSLTINKPEKLYSIYNYYNNEYLNNNIKYLYKGIKENITERIYIVYLYQKYLSKLYINTFKFNIINISNVSKIISNIYNKKVIVNIINVKYLHMDNGLFIDAIVRKLRDRNKRVLKVLRKAITLSKIPSIHPLLLIKANEWIQETLELNYKNIMYKNIISNCMQTIKKNIFQSIKNIHIIGIRLEGKGRLTRRLTASRSVFKVTYIGTMKNIFSSYQGKSAMLSKGFEKSNLDYLNVNSYNRNGSFGIKSYHNTF